MRSRTPPPHAVSQQTPSMQLPEVHCVDAPQGTPFAKSSLAMLSSVMS